MIKLLICDDAPETREALRVLLAGQPEIEIVEEAENGEEAIALAIAYEPDVVLMDVSMPILDGVEATRRIRELLPGTRIVAFAGSDETETVMAMMDAGASAYCLKGAPLWELERAIAGASEPLVRLAQAMTRTVHGGGTGEFVARELAELTNAALAATYLSAPDIGLSLSGAAGIVPRDGLIAAPEIVVRAFTQRALVEADVHELAELFRLGCPSAEAVAVPIVADGEAFGALLVAVPANVTAELDRELVCAVADLVAAAIANERRLALTFAEARRDALTGLLNRRAFDEHLEKLTRRAIELEHDVTLALLDLDDFKQINDREGHLVGDRVLCDVGRAVMRTLRADEEVFRIGGEEFAVVIMGSAEAGRIVAERIRTELLAQRRGHYLPTVSIGIASVPAHALDKEELLRKADIALYGAKWAGKDGVVVFGADRPPAEVQPTVDVAEPAVEPLAQLVDEEPDSLDADFGPTRGEDAAAGPALEAARTVQPRDERVRILLVDDDPGLRLLLRTTFDVVEIEVDEAESAEVAAAKIAIARPDVVVLDIGMPGMDGLSFCRKLKADWATKDVGVVLLTGSDAGTEAAATAAGADALLRKPFSPLDLLAVVEQVAGGLYEGPFGVEPPKPPDEQLLLYAQDLRRLLDIERGQRTLLQKAYRETVMALATALESKDLGTGAHSQRVRRYAAELTSALDPRLLQDPSLEYGFLLHDVGKIGIPDKILQKRAGLTRAERRLMQTHTVLGDQMLDEVALLHGEGLRVVRSHHERWDGRGYPDRLRGSEIPLGARVFAAADALDAMTSDRPYRTAGTWDDAVAEIMRQSKRQFDPDVVDAFLDRQEKLHEIHDEVAAAADEPVAA